MLGPSAYVHSSFKHKIVIFLKTDSFDSVLVIYRDNHSEQSCMGDIMKKVMKDLTVACSLRIKYQVWLLVPSFEYFWYVHSERLHLLAAWCLSVLSGSNNIRSAECFLFSWNFILRSSAKICLNLPVFVKAWQKRTVRMYFPEWILNTTC